MKVGFIGGVFPPSLRRVIHYLQNENEIQFDSSTINIVLKEYFIFTVWFYNLILVVL